MTKYSYDYLTPKEQQALEKAITHRKEIEIQIKKLEKLRLRNTRKVLKLFEIAEKRMNDK